MLYYDCNSYCTLIDALQTLFLSWLQRNRYESLSLRLCGVMSTVS